MPIGRFGRRKAQHVYVRNDAVHRVEQLPAQFRVGHHGERAAEARDVPGLGRRHQRDRPFRDGLVQHGDRDVPGVFVQHQSAMDLVRADHQIVTFGDLRDRRQFFARKHSADRIVRIAQHQQAAARRDGALETAEIPRPTALGAAQVDRRQAAVRIARRTEKRRVDRCGGQHLVAGFADRPAHDVESAHQSGQPYQPVRVDRPAVVAFQRFDDRPRQRHRRAAIAEDAVIHPRVQRIDDARGGREIHVGDPHRQDVAAGILAPLDAVAAVSIGRMVEVEIHEAARQTSRWL